VTTVARTRRVAPERLAKYQSEKEAIIRAAYSLIGRSGWKGTSVQEILRDTGLSTRSFYRHFRSKDELMVAMYRRDAERVTAALDKAVGEARTALAALDAWIDQNLAIVYDPRRAGHAVALASPEAASADGYAAAFAEGAIAQRAVLVDLLRRGKDDGVFPLADPEPDAYAIHAIVMAHMRARLQQEPGYAREDARRHTLELCQRALGVPSTAE
jgi:AcrR family transcriptional regulator